MTGVQTCALPILALASVIVLMLSGCGVSAARESALREAKTKPLPSVNAWVPGLVALSDYSSSGLGPVGYPNVDGKSSQGDSTNQLSGAQALLDSTSLQTSDLASVTISLMENGDTLKTPTLDFCGKKYASEDLRAHRRQVAGTFNNGGSWVSSESVLYESPAAAQQAITELVAAKKACPEGTTYKGKMGTDISMSFFAAPGPNETQLQPAGSRVILNFIETPSDSAQSTQRIFMAVQVRGSLLVAFYVVEGTSETFTQDNLDALYGFVSLLTERMNAADSAAIGLN